MWSCSPSNSSMRAAFNSRSSPGALVSRRNNGPAGCKRSSF
jgi:hypothetical protein